MNAYTTDPEEIRSALMHADEDDVQLIGDSCAGLAQILVTLTQRVGILEHEVQKSQIAQISTQLTQVHIDLKSQIEALEQAIGLAAYENGEDHL